MMKHFVTDNLKLDYSMHNAWQQKLESMGYPQLTERNIAVSNGSECGITQDFGPGDELFYLNGNIKPSVLTSVVTNLIPGFNASTSLYLASLFNDNAPYINLLPGGRTIFVADFTGNAQPKYHTKQIYSGQLTLKKRLFWIIKINAHLTNESVNSDSSILPFDYYGGGIFEIDNITADINGVAQQLDDDIPSILGSINISARSQATYDYIPTPSALDIGGSANGLAHEDYLRGYSGGMPPSPPLQTPFDAYVSAFGDGFNNEPHINILPRNGNFIASHLEDPIPDVFDCLAFCENSEPIGPDVVCTSAQYSISGFSGVVNWFISPSGIANVDSNGRVSRISNNSGVVTLNAQISGDCGTVTLSKEINIGTVSQPIDDYILFNGFPVLLVETQTMDGYDIQWTVNRELIGNPDPNVTWMWIDLRDYDCSDYNLSLSVRVNGECGWSNFETKLYDCRNFYWYTRTSEMIYPNPAKNQVTIDIAKAGFKNSKSGNNELYTISIINQMGHILKQLETQNQQVVIDVSDLRAGAYYVFIQSNGELIKQSLIIE